MILLCLATLFWGGNTVAGRFAVGNISPFLLTHLRWSILTVLLLFIYRKRLLEIVQHFLGWWKYFVMGGIALGGFNMLFYTAAHHTTAINLGILQGSIPIVVIVGSFFLFKKKITVTQSVGIVIGLIGVLELASGGNLQRLIEVDLNIGDMYMLLGCALFASYTLGLQKRPDGDEIIGLLILSATAQLITAPGLIYEVVSNEIIWPTSKGWLIVIYVTLCTSFLAHLFYIRSVQLIGAGLCGLFSNLTPIFSALLAVSLLGEKFGQFHAIALMLVLSGLWLAQKPLTKRTEA